MKATARSGSSDWVAAGLEHRRHVDHVLGKQAIAEGLAEPLLPCVELGNEGKVVKVHVIEQLTFLY